MLCRNAIRLVLPGMLLNGFGGANKYTGDSRIISLGSKSAALFLNFRKRF
jgi:hypothetical protein